MVQIMGHFFHFSGFLGENTFQIDSGLKSSFLFCFRFQVLLGLQAKLLETSPFSIGPNGFDEHFSQVFIVLGMYNFEHFMVLYGAVTVPRLTTHCRKTAGSRDVHSAHTEMVKIAVPIRMLVYHLCKYFLKKIRIHDLKVHYLDSEVNYVWTS